MSRRVAISAVPVALAGAAVVAPMMAVSGHELASWAITTFFSLVCHQEAQRSFWLWGTPVAVCVRCLGIYVGAAVGGFARMGRATTLRLLAVTLALNGIDALTEMAGLHGNIAGARFVLGATLGAAIAAMVTAGFSGEPMGRSADEPICYSAR